jgi:starch synthase
MPSLIEPCGESQLAALRYGASPIAPPLGGLRDTLDFAPDGDEPAAGAATAFGIRPPVSPDSISQAVRNAMDSTPARLAAMRREGMRRRFEWAASAEAYAQVYARCLEQTD